MTFKTIYLFMKEIYISVIIGLGAGIIDVVPMIIKKVGKFECISAFIHWFVLGIFIPFINWNIPLWITGVLLGLFTSVPIMVLVFKNEKKAIIPMIFFSIILGALVGIVGNLFIN